MDTRRSQTDIAQTLSVDQAAVMLSKSPRHVRRLIARGDLEGTREPYRTTRAAVDAYRFRQRTKGGDNVRPEVREHATPLDRADGHVDGLVCALAHAQATIERLAREVGRLEAELAQTRRQAAGGRRENGTRVGVLGRVGLWLRTRG